MNPQITLLLASLLMGLAVMLAGFWIGPLWDTLARRQVRDLTPRMEELNMDTSKVPLYLRVWGAALAGSLFVFVIIFRLPLLAPVVVYLIYVAPRLALNHWIERRRILLRDQMVTACTTLANASRAGLALAQGLEAIGKEIPKPLATEIRRMVVEFHRGRPLAETIRDTKERLNLESFTLFASAILSCLERGGKVTEALDRISKSLLESQRLERKLEADTASGRRVVLILGLFPFAFLIGFYLMDPLSTGLLFSTIVGQIVLVVVTVMVYAAIMWARSILRLDV